MTQKAQRQIEETLRAIDEVHGLPTSNGWEILRADELNRIEGFTKNGKVPIEWKTASGPRYGGLHQLANDAEHPNAVYKIDILAHSNAEGGLNPQYVLVHEFGHFMDYCALNASKSGESLLQTGARIAADLKTEVGTATKARGESATELERLAAELHNAFTETKTFQDVLSDKSAWGEYFRSPEELWARGYAQWIAERSTNAVLKKAVEESFNTRELDCWTKQEFERIGKAFDAIFKHVGVLHGKY
jgi:hypothetical protein